MKTTVGRMTAALMVAGLTFPISCPGMSISCWNCCGFHSYHSHRVCKPHVVKVPIEVNKVDSTSQKSDRKPARSWTGSDHALATFDVQVDGFL